MSTIAPLPNCPACHGTGKTVAGFCLCLSRPNDSVDIFPDGGWGMKMESPPLNADEVQKTMKEIAKAVTAPKSSEEG